MAAENAEYERVLGELKTVCDDILDLCGEMNLDKIKNDLQFVSQKSKEQMETLKRLKFEIESLRVMNKSLEAENTMLKLNVEHIVIGKDGKGGEGEGGEDAEEESGEGELGEGEGGEDKSGEGGEDESKDEEGGDVAFEDPVDLSENESEDEEGSGENEDEHGSRIWNTEPGQIKKIVDYIGSNFFLNDEHEIEPKFKFKFGGSKGYLLDVNNLRNAVETTTENYLMKKLKRFKPDPGSIYKRKMQDDKSWEKYKGQIQGYLSK
jgi:hypothetical protein